MINLKEIFSGTAQAQAPASSSAAPGGAFGMFLPMIFVFVIFYLLLIRPQAKQRKKHQEMIKGLKKGDEVVTAAGIHGKISSLNEGTLMLEVAENIRFKLDKGQVVSVKAAVQS